MMLNLAKPFDIGPAILDIVVAVIPILTGLSIGIPDNNFVIKFNDVAANIAGAASMAISESFANPLAVGPDILDMTLAFEINIVGFKNGTVDKILVTERIPTAPIKAGPINIPNNDILNIPLVKGPEIADIVEAAFNRFVLFITGTFASIFVTIMTALAPRRAGKANKFKTLNLIIPFMKLDEDDPIA